MRSILTPVLAMSICCLHTPRVACEVQRDIKAWLSDPGSNSLPSAPTGGSKAPTVLLEDKLADVEESLPSTRPRLIQWSEDLIEENGGTILAIAGSDYSILASDTRLSADYQIRSRNVTRIMKVSPRTALGTAGGWADVLALRKEVSNDLHDRESTLERDRRFYQLGYELGRYSAQHGIMTTSALATFLSNRLYLHRLKPLYALNVVAGLDSTGAGSVYTYDAVGSYNRVAAACCGRGQKLMQPVLDGLASKMEEDTIDGRIRPIVAIDCEEAIKVVKEAFLSGAEREISIGDEAELMVFKQGRPPEIHRLELPRH